VNARSADNRADVSHARSQDQHGLYVHGFCPVLTFDEQQVSGVVYCGIDLVSKPGRASDAILSATVNCAGSEGVRGCRKFLDHRPDEGLVFLVCHALPFGG